jgi:hypothetical protein
MVDFADLVMFGDRIRSRFLQPAAMDHADADMRLADIDIPHLLVEQLLRKRFFRVALKLACGHVGPRAHDAGRLGIGGIHPGGILGQRRLTHYKV